MRSGHVDTATRFSVGGWAGDSTQPDLRVGLRVLVDGKGAGEITADRHRPDIAASGKFSDGRHGFLYSFKPPLSADANHTIEVRFADTDASLPNGIRRIDAEAPASPPPRAREEAPAAPQPRSRDEARMIPILVTAPGRSGTTLLMSSLAASPAIVAAELVPYELRLLSYYAAAFNVLTSAANLERSTHPDRLEGDGFHVGFNPFNSDQYAQAFRTASSLRDYRANYVPARVASAMRDIVEEHYLRLAADRGKTQVRYFAEKGNNMHQPTREFVRRSFPEIKEIVIVRDPRDVLCSHMSYFSSEIERAFGHLSHASKQLMGIAREKRNDVCIIHYEDMLFGKPRCFDKLSAFLGTEVALPAAERGSAMFTRHATSDTPSASVGRWHEQLPAEYQARCNKEWGDFLKHFGYEGSTG